MKQFITNIGGGKVTRSNWPVKEIVASGKAEPVSYKSELYNLDETVMKEIEEGEKKIEFVDGKMTVVESTEKADREAAWDAKRAEAEALQAEKDALKEKMADGSATLEDIQQALTKLL